MIDIEENRLCEELEKCKINKGTGAGGKQTTKKGIAFEEKTDYEIKLKENKVEKIIINNKLKYSYYYKHNNIIFTKSKGLKCYLSMKYKILEHISREPDEVFLIERERKIPIMIIIEKKNQNTEGSVIDKLGAVDYYITQYTKYYGEYFKIKYIFVISEFLEKKFNEARKNIKDLKEYLEDKNVKLLYGDKEDYFSNLELIIFDN